MPTYKIKEKFFSIHQEYNIKDENDVICYTIKGKFFSFGDKLTMTDAKTGEEVCKIEQKGTCVRRWVIISGASVYFVVTVIIVIAR